MGERTYTLADMIAAYEAGCERGNSEALAYDWGCRASGDHFDGLAEALHEVLNRGLSFDNAAYVRFEDVERLICDATPSPPSHAGDGRG